MSKNSDDKFLPYANKSLGQHFLIDFNIIQKITSDFADECDAIIEVGPGPAILTKKLAEKNKELFVVERDKRFVDDLAELMPQKNITIADALELDWQDLILEKGLSGKKVWLVSNLPYNISSQLFVLFLQVPEIHFMTLMFQKEVADKIYREMSSLHSLGHNYFEVKWLGSVKPGAFKPPPKVDSGIISCKRHDEPCVSLAEFKKFESFLRATFAMRRKQIFKVLKTVYTPEVLEAALAQSEIDKTERAHNLSLPKVLKLYRNISSN